MSTIYIVILQQMFLKQMMKRCKHYLLKVCNVRHKNIWLAQLYSISVSTVYIMILQQMYLKEMMKRCKHYLLKVCNVRHKNIYMVGTVIQHCSEHSIYVVILQQMYLKEMVNRGKHCLLKVCKVSERNMVKCCQHYLLEACNSQLLGDPAMGHGC